MKKKTFTIAGTNVSVDFDERVFYCEDGYDNKNFPFCDVMSIEQGYISGDIVTPYGVINSEKDRDELEKWVASTVLDHRHFRGSESLAGADLSCLFKYSDILTFSKKAFPQFTFDGNTGLICMFKFCSYLKNVDLSGMWSPSIEYMHEMFCCCPELVKVDFSGWDFTNINVSCTFSVDESVCPVLSTVVLKDCKGPLEDIVGDIAHHAIIREFAHTYYTSAKELANSDSGEWLSYDVAEKFLSGEFRSDVTTIIVSPDRYAEVIKLVDNAYYKICEEYKKYPWFKYFPDKSAYKTLVRVVLSNGNTDSETTSLLVDKIREAFSKGNNEKEIYNLLKEEGRSDYDIVCAMACVGFDLDTSNNDIVSSYCRKVINPQIRDVLKPNSGVTVGEVVGSLYKSYPKALVDHAMVLYTWEMSPSVEE